MAIPRVYITAELAIDNTIDLDIRAAQHINKVLRLRSDQSIILFNGNGHDYAATLVEVSKRKVSARITTAAAESRESSLNITLALSVSKGSKMDFAIQKAVELGVNTIQPLTTVRSVVKLDDDRAQKRQQHWQSIVHSACEQCGRNQIPQVYAPTDLDNWLTNLDSFSGYVLDPTAKTSLADAKPASNKIILLIGPEGGLSTEEIQQSAENGFTAVQLGPRILRTETAGLAAISAMQTLWGDFA